MSAIANVYWRIRHAGWDFQEHLLIRLLSQRMSRTPVLYVHPRSGGPPRAVVYLLDDHGEIVKDDPWDHDHVEGRSR